MPITNRPRTTTTRPAPTRGRAAAGTTGASSTTAASATTAARQTVDAIDAIDAIDALDEVERISRVPASPLGPAPTPVPDAERTALLDGAHVDPHKLLGAKTVTVDGKARTQIHALFPSAKEVAVVLPDGQRVPMKRGPDGLFDLIVPGKALVPVARYQLDVTAKDGTSKRVDDPYRFAPTVDEAQLFLFKQGTLEDASKLLGAHPMKVDGVEGFNLVVWAPNARGVAAVGDFNGWSRSAHMMRRLHDSVFEVFIPGAKSGNKYKLSMLGHDGKRVDKADPAMRSSEMRPGNSSVLVGQSTHTWSDQQYLAARAQSDQAKEAVSTYEVHLPSWKKNSDGTMMNYRDLAKELIPHLQKHKFNAIELVGLAEHPLDDSWGYQVTGYFAPTSRHGTPDDFKFFVDEMHKAGIKIIYDWVPAHFPKDEHGLASFDGTNLFDHKDPRQGEHLDWGTRIFNYGRNEVKSFLTSSLVHMLDEYHLDGVRVDAVASMLYLDYSRKDWIPNQKGGNENLDAIAFLQDVNTRISRRFPGVLKIAEESTSWPGVTKPAAEGGLGFDLKWNMGWMNDTLEFFKTDTAHRGAALDRLTNTLLWAWAEKFVVALSHDEVVHLKKSLVDKMPGDDWQKHANLRVLLAYMTSYPGHKLLFMGTELAQKSEWDFKNALDWNNGDDGTSRLLSDLNALYANEPALSQAQFDPKGTELRVRDAVNAVVGVARADGKGSEVLFMHNLTETPRMRYRVGVDTPGKYAEVLNTDASIYGGSGMGNLGGVEAEAVPMHGKLYSIEVTLPPLGTVAFKHSDDKRVPLERPRRERVPITGPAHTMRRGD